MPSGSPLRRYPRSRTNKTNTDRVSYVLDVEIEGRQPGWAGERRPRHPQCLARIDTLVTLAGGLNVSAGALLEGLDWTPGETRRGRFEIALANGGVR